MKVRNEAETVGGVWFQVASLGLNSKFNKPKRKNPRQRQATPPNWLLGFVLVINKFIIRRIKIMGYTIQNNNSKIEIVDGIHYTKNVIKDWILDQVNDDFYTDFTTDSLLGEKEIKDNFLEKINTWTNQNSWGSGMVYNSNVLKFYDENHEFIDEYVDEQAREQGLNYTQLINSFNRRWNESKRQYDEGDIIVDIDDIKIKCTVFAIESNAYYLHEEIYSAKL